MEYIVIKFHDQLPAGTAWSSRSFLRGVRVVEGGGLENRCIARYRGFESHLLRFSVINSLGRGARAVESAPVKELYPERVPGVRIPLRNNVPIAQLDRVSDCGSDGRRFESSWVRFFLERCESG